MYICCGLFFPQEGQKLKDEKPDFDETVDPKLEELKAQWAELENTTQNKGERLFDANKHVLYEQSCDDIDGWINEIESQIVTEDVGHDLTTVNLLVQKQNVRLYDTQKFLLYVTQVELK